MSEALKIVLTTHLTFCVACRRVVADLETIGGIMIEEIEPASMSLLTPATPFTQRPLPILDRALPAPLNRVPMGRWWPIGGGFQWRPLRVVGPAWGGLLWGKPGGKLPRHRHEGIELACVLQGSFIDGSGEYFVGDISDPEEGDHVDPPITITGSQPCLCVLASEGMHLRGALGFLQRSVDWIIRT